MLYWAYECLPYVLDIPIEPHFHDHMTELENAIRSMGERYRDFYHGMSKDGGIAASDNEQFNFWIRFGWLACSFAIGREWGKADDLHLDEEPPHSWDSDNKQWWWKTRLVGSPFHCAMDSPLACAGDMKDAFEDRHQDACTAAASAEADSEAADKAADAADEDFNTAAAQAAEAKRVAKAAIETWQRARALAGSV